MSDKISDPRDEFEKIFPIPSATIRCGTGYAVTSYSAWEGQAYENKWEGWKAARRAADSAQFKKGVEAAANFIDQKRDAMDAAFSQVDPDTGSVEFYTQEAQDLSCEFLELAEQIRDLAKEG